ncbi:MAG: 2-dehydro-3-deoxygalactonokinase [Pseudomonadota bacterium]
MMRPSICGDWGNTHLRLFLMGAASEAPRRGRGVLRCETDQIETELWAAAGDWMQRFPEAPILLCGAAGSNVGLFDAGYRACPIALNDLARGMVERPMGGRRIAVAPGLICENAFGEPNTLRGEETQLLGWFASGAAPAGKHLICLPGTHTKWACLRDGEVVNFTTALTGEVFELISEGSLITRGSGQDFDLAAFAEGVRLIEAHGPQRLLNLLFTIRARQLTGRFELSKARSHLSGVLIAADVASALSDRPTPSSVTLIGAPELCRLYETVMNRSGIDCETFDGEAAVCAGLSQLAAGADAA